MEREKTCVSDFYRERQRVKRLESEISSMKEMLKSFQNQPASAVETKPKESSVNEKLYWENPIQYQKEFEAKIRKEIGETLRKEILEKDLPQFINETEQKKTLEREGREALELLLPTDKNSPNASLEERLNRHAARVERLNEIIRENGLEVLWDKSPKKATQLALRLFEVETQAAMSAQRNPAAPTSKGQMASTATGSPNGGGVKVMTLNELKGKIEQQDKKLNENPDLRFEPQFQAERQSIKNELSKRFKELQAQQ